VSQHKAKEKTWPRSSQFMGQKPTTYNWHSSNDPVHGVRPVSVLRGTSL